MSQFQRIGGVWRSVGRILPARSKANHHQGPRCDRCHQPKSMLHEVEVQPKTIWGPRTTKVCVSCMPAVLAEQRALAQKKAKSGRAA